MDLPIKFVIAILSGKDQYPEVSYWGECCSVFASYTKIDNV